MFQFYKVKFLFHCGHTITFLANFIQPELYISVSVLQWDIFRTWLAVWLGIITQLTGSLFLIRWQMDISSVFIFASQNVNCVSFFHYMIYIVIMCVKQAHNQFENVLIIWSSYVYLVITCLWPSPWGECMIVHPVLGFLHKSVYNCSFATHH